MEVSESTFHRRRAQHGGMKADNLKRLYEFGSENQLLKRIAANSELEIDALKVDREGKLASWSRRRQWSWWLVIASGWPRAGSWDSGQILWPILNFGLWHKHWIEGPLDNLVTNALDC